MTTTAKVSWQRETERQSQFESNKQEHDRHLTIYMVCTQNDPPLSPCL